MAKFKESVFENEYLREFVKDEEEAKKIGSWSSKKIVWACPNCKSEKKDTPGHIKIRGFSCKVCNDSRSYAERLMEQLLIDNDIEYESQKRFENCVYKSELPFDFYLPKYNICIEMQGEQHYDKRKNSAWYNERVEVSDDIKKEFCIREGIEYIAINCTYSDLNFIINNILKTNLNKILNIIDKNSLRRAVLTRILNVDVNYLIDRHNQGVSFLRISEETGLDRKRIISILKKLGYYKPRNGLKNNSRKVVCLNNNKVFNSLKEAIKYANLNNETNITAVCRGRRKIAGKHPETGEPLKWMYYEDYINQ